MLQKYNIVSSWVLGTIKLSNISIIIASNNILIKVKEIKIKIVLNDILCIFKYSLMDLFSIFNKTINREVDSTNANENPISSLNLKISCNKNTKKKLIIKKIIYLVILIKSLQICLIL